MRFKLKYTRYDLLEMVCLMLTVALNFYHYYHPNLLTLTIISGFVGYGMAALFKDLKELFCG